MAVDESKPCRTVSPGAPFRAAFVYPVKLGLEAEFRELVSTHWATLGRHGLVTSLPARVLCGTDHRGRLWVVERFEWVDGAAAGRASAVGEVRTLWQRMELLLQVRGILPVPLFPVSRSERLSITPA